MNKIPTLALIAALGLAVPAYAQAPADTNRPETPNVGDHKDGEHREGVHKEHKKEEMKKHHKKKRHEEEKDHHQ